MKVINLWPEYFLDEYNKTNLSYLNTYCNSINTPIVYHGDLYVRLYRTNKFSFKNIINAVEVYVENISFIVPDLTSAKLVCIHGSEFLMSKDKIDIGKLKEVDYFYISYNYNNPDYHTSYLKNVIKKNIKIIDANTLIVNGKTLHIKTKWSFYGKINITNYKRYGLYDK